MMCAFETDLVFALVPTVAAHAMTVCIWRVPGHAFHVQLEWRLAQSLLCKLAKMDTFFWGRSVLVALPIVRHVRISWPAPLAVCRIIWGREVLLALLVLPTAGYAPVDLLALSVLLDIPRVWEDALPLVVALSVLFVFHVRMDNV